jgi:ATP-binding cassette, subfamily B, bacterial RamA/AmfB
VRRPSPDRLLLATARRGGGWVAVLALTEAAGAVTAIAAPAALGSAIDAVLGTRRVVPALAFLGAVLAVEVLAAAIGTIASAGCSSLGTAWVRRTVVDHILAVGVRGRFATGDLTSRLVGNAAETGAVVPIALQIGTGTLISAGGLVALWLLDWRLAAVVVAMLAVTGGLVRVLVRRMSDLYLRYDGLVSQIAARLADALAGATTIRASGTRDREIARVLSPLPELADTGHGLWRVQARAAWRVSVLSPLARVSVLAMAGVALTAGRLGPGEFVAASFYATLALELTDQIIAGLELARVRAGARRLTDVLSQPAPRTGTRRPIGAGLLFHRVSVSLDGRPVLRDIDLSVPAGTSVAVVGRSGSGKSVLALLAGRLLEPDHGQVLLDGCPLPEVHPDELRRRVAYAFERPYLLGATVAESIAYGRPDASPAEVIAAARLACADAFVSRLPSGYGTPLAQAPMSAGERQRLGLARAFVQGCRVLILDDATSSLDTATQAQIGAALAGGLANRTRLIIAHRPATAAGADVVAWLDEGRLLAVAPHRLLWRDRHYRAVFATSSGTRVVRALAETR